MSDLLLTYYGDDFTGSTDVLESLTVGGVETVLFVEPPGDAWLRAHERSAHVRAGTQETEPLVLREGVRDPFARLVAKPPRRKHERIVLVDNFLPGNRHRPEHQAQIARLLPAFVTCACQCTACRA